MKKLHILFFLLVIPILVLLFSFFSTSASAQVTQSATTTVRLTPADAIYADLAVRGLLDNVSLVYMDGNSVNDIKLNETRQWIPASTIKTYVAMYAYKKVAEGQLSLNDTVTIDPKNVVTTELVTETLPTLLSGDVVTIHRLITQMITQSDNTAFNQLLGILGRNNVTSYVQSLGLSDTKIGSKLNLDDSQTQYEFTAPGYGDNTTTATDYAKAFQLIKSNGIPMASNLFAILKEQKINNMIPLFLPKTVICAHKTGDLAPLYHDGGICQDSTRSYILTIFTNADDPTLLAHLSEIIYSKNYSLVGKSLNDATIGEEPLNFPLDPLVMVPHKQTVLGTNTIKFPVPDVTLSDLGLKPTDLSLTLQDKQLPSVVIPADSPFHFLTSSWQLMKKIVVFGPNARLGVDIETAKLHLAEAKDLLKRNKTTAAQEVLNTTQTDITRLAQNNITKSTPDVQNTIVQISQTRFSIFSQALNQTTGETRLSTIKEIAMQAKATIQTVQPSVPQAVSANNPSQKPLIGTVIHTSSENITVKTAGGQEIIVPTRTNPIMLSENQLVGNSSLSSSSAQSISPTPEQSVRSLKEGTTVALVGSNTNQTFTPSLILINIPKELAAPQPVTVVKVNAVQHTLVVSENGVYTQVNITPKTTIKGADTNIPLKSIQVGDIIVVHGQPLSTVQPLPSVSPIQTISMTSAPTHIGIISPTMQQTPSSQPMFLLNTTPSIIITPSIITSISPIQATTYATAPSLSPTSTIQITPTSTPQQPKVIQSVSIQVIQKSNAPSSHSSTPTPTTQQNQQSNTKSTQQQPSQHPTFPPNNPTTTPQQKKLQH